MSRSARWGANSFAARLRHLSAACTTMLVLACTGDESLQQKDEQRNLFFVGQDLGAIRDYVGSDCCAVADGGTAYVGLYNVLSADSDFGGLGLTVDGTPTDLEGSWGSGPVNAHKTATEFGFEHLAIGLFIGNNDEPGALEALVRGEHDDKVEQLAKLFGSVRGQVFLRIGYEFDGAWNTGYENTENYKAAWQRIVGIIRQQGATNVQFVWQSSSAPIDDAIEGKREDISDWYPGDDYVDWMALSWFIDGDEELAVELAHSVPNARTLADEVLAFARAHGKPVMIAEAAPQGFDIDELTTSHHSPLWDGDPNTNTQELSAHELWEAWFAPFFRYVHANDDVIDAIAYISCDWEAQPMWGPPYESGYWGDTRVSANPEIASRWNEAISSWRDAKE
ncbi:MAG: hypothetical protein HRU11_10010 [Parvularculaceae bacterium]|nr:hypothetical protein [Parvularculaceae bacterium]